MWCCCVNGVGGKRLPFARDVPAYSLLATRCLRPCQSTVVLPQLLELGSVRRSSFLLMICHFQIGHEWVAAIALSIQALIFLLQAFIFAWQALILRRHATTLEEHTATAKLIKEALDQQKTVLNTQSEIMSKQLELQRQVDEKAEREVLFGSVIKVQVDLETLARRLQRVQLSTVTGQDRADASDLFNSLAGSVAECRKALLVAIHVGPEEKKPFVDFCDDVASVPETGDPAKDLKPVVDLREKYKGISRKLGMLAKRRVAEK